MVSYLRPIAISLMLGTAALALSACSRTFNTTYTSVAPATVDQWRVKDVRVVVPASLTVSNADSFIPNADIVWHGDALGDRKVQVAKLIETGVRNGVTELRGKQPVIFTVTLRRFHSITPKSYLMGPSGTGVHSIAFDLTVNDARTGAVISGPLPFEASIPSQSKAELGAKATGTALPAGQWKAAITQHITATIRGWTGKGPDARRSFTRMGA